jgi:hypothetical protein
VITGDSFILVCLLISNLAFPAEPGSAHSAQDSKSQDAAVAADILKDLRGSGFAGSKENPDQPTQKSRSKSSSTSARPGESRPSAKASKKSSGDVNSDTAIDVARLRSDLKDWDDEKALQREVAALRLRESQREQQIKARGHAQLAARIQLADQQAAQQREAAQVPQAAQLTDQAGSDAGVNCTDGCSSQLSTCSAQYETASESYRAKGYANIVGMLVTKRAANIDPPPTNSCGAEYHSCLSRCSQ